MLLPWRIKPMPVRRQRDDNDAAVRAAMLMSQPSISVSAHLLAKRRLADAQKRGYYCDFGGGPVWVSTGAVFADDYTRRDGYACVASLQDDPRDRYGWPVGDPRSPASLTAR